MKKSARKLLAMSMAASMALSSVGIQAFAAEPEISTQVTEENGLVTTVTTEKTATDSNAEMTVVVKIETKTKGTTPDGVSVDYVENKETTEVTNADGTTTASVTDGKETKEWNEDDDGSAPGQPEVEVPLVSGSPIKKDATDEDVDTEVDGTHSETTKTTTTERTVTATTSEFTTKIEESDKGLVPDSESVLNGPVPVYDEEDGKVLDQEGKEGLFDRNYLSSQSMDKITIGDIIIWVNDSSKVISDIYVPEGVTVPDEFSYMVGMDVTAWYLDKDGKVQSNPYVANITKDAKINTDIAINKINNWYKEDEMIFNQPENGDFMYVGTGEHSLYYAAFVNVTYEKDINGNPILDEKGNPIIKSITTSDGTVVTIDGVPATELPDKVSLKPVYDNYSGSRAQNFMLMDKEGNRVYGYCCDLGTGTTEGCWYSVSNLEDSDYYASEESEEHIRSILMNGYWGTSDVPKDDKYEMGSLEGIKKKLKEAIEKNELDNPTIQIPKVDGNGNPIIGADGKQEMESKTMLELLDGLTEGEALLATQAAVWSYSNNSFAVKSGKDGRTIIDPDGYKWNQDLNTGSKLKDKKYDLGTLNDFGSARVDFLYNWLINLDTQDQSTVVINDKNFVDSMSLTVGDKVADHENNKDDNSNNDVYHTELNFRLAFIPGENDDLLVQITYNDLEGKPVNVVRRLAGKNAEDQTYEDIKPEEDGSYILKGLKLSENEDFNFDLRLEGTQYLEKGVYVYAPVGGRDVSQTFVGVAEGERNVDVSVGVTVSFDVDENNHVVAERTWHDETSNFTPNSDDDNENSKDPGDDPDPTPDDPVEIPPQVLEEYDEKEPDVGVLGAFDTVEILDDMIPLGVLPATGDRSPLWILLSILSAFGLAGTAFADRKRRIDEQ